jgi:hypothetical protein
MPKKKIKKASLPPLVDKGRDIKFAGGLYQDEFLTIIKGAKALKTYREMRDNDATISAILLAYENMLRSCVWSVSGKYGKANKMIASNFARLNWMDTLGDILTMLAYGFSILEINYIIDPSGKIGWGRWAYRPQASLERWEYDPNNLVTSVVQRVDMATLTIPLTKCLHFKAGSSGNSPEGRSLLRGAVRSWFYKKAYEEILGAGVEKDLVGFPTLQPPEGIDFGDKEFEDEKEWAEKFLGSLRVDSLAGATIPSGWKFELVPSPGKRQYDVLSIIEYYDKRIALSMLAQFILLGMERIGSYGLAKSQTELFYDGLEGWARRIADVIQRQAISVLCNIHYPNMAPEDMPIIKPAHLRKIDFASIAAFISAASKGMLLPDDVVDLQTSVGEIVKNELR